MSKMDNDPDHGYVPQPTFSPQVQSSGVPVPPEGPMDESNELRMSNLYPEINSSDAAEWKANAPALNTATNKEYKNLYSLLELISEQGSGGLVDKVIISQDSLGRFINKIKPGAYKSVTKVDFKALDTSFVQPIGVYGSRNSIISFFQDFKILDDEQAHQLLLAEQNETSKEALQPGLYIALPSQSITQGLYLYVVFWPEKETWQDNASSSVRRNRITFMRYLTKITHQILCLFTEEESRSFVWNTEMESTDMHDNNEDEVIDRMFSFEVAKTLEQKEDVITRQGFVFALPPQILETSSASFENLSEEPKKPFVLKGERSQGFLTTHFVDSKSQETQVSDQSHNRLSLSNFLSTGRIELKPDINVNSILLLLEHDIIQDRFPNLCKQAKEQKKCLDAELTTFKTAETTQSDKEQCQKDTILLELVRRMKEDFPVFKFDEKVKHIQDVRPTHEFSNLILLYPKVRQEFEQEYQRMRSKKIGNHQYCALRLQLITVDAFLSEPDFDPKKKDEIVSTIFSTSGPTYTVTGFPKFWDVRTWFSSSPTKYEENALAKNKDLTEAQFLESLVDTSRYGGELASEHISKAVQLALSTFEGELDKVCTTLHNKIRSIQRQAMMKHINALVYQKREAELARWRSKFIQDIHDSQSEQKPERRVLSLNNVSSNQSHGRHLTPDFRVSYAEKIYMDPFFEFKIHTLELTADHRQNLQLDPRFVPKPHINERFSSAFQLPINHKILFGQLLSNDKLLLIIDDQQGAISFYSESFVNIGNAVEHKRSCKVIRQEKTGKDVVIAFDECKRMVALYAAAKAHLYIFLFDENFASLQSWAHPVELSQWYEAGTTVFHMCFVTGTEELLMVDNQAHGRVFSLVTQQFRPATLKLPRMPLNIYTSPDGACFLALFENDSGQIIRAYHWTTFGSSTGISIALDPTKAVDGMALSSFISRSSVHLIVFNFEDKRCDSIVLDITKKATEFMFQEKSASRHVQQEQFGTVNNCLLDCYSDVWTRFPVVPAIQRSTGISVANHPPKRIICLTSHNSSKVAAYFSTMIRTFEQKTRKPTGDELSSIRVSSLTIASLKSNFIEKVEEAVSKFNAGGWIVGILCLIPIHLAITKENRFIPLKDGVISADYERSLLGADVSTVADSISFGWYESILQSYMAIQPVKVVSSMGEQSVGKSYSLNHLADTSFAGSAMRTTEGVWMSITPTDDMLLVALDFEGVHSIERSAQEDTLLVLFNTAISNLVLFRNNFALSRDITGLFQSFQSSSVVFDPAANPTLFRSTLVIIIKDVVDSDKKEIVREFSLKFQKIVQEEQESNFISRLHRGQLSIVPWPVIESKQFYTLFPAIAKTHLDKQPVTHGNAGNFLQTVKTLMAKLKANDWRSLSQSMAGNRAHRLLSLLQNALVFGYSEIEPHPEPLKDLDSDIEIESQDTSCRLFLSDSESGSGGDRDTQLAELCQSWDGYKLRSVCNEAQWVEDLTRYLTNLVDARVNHVQAWISQNLRCFKQTTHANITLLHRELDSAVINIKANMELCKQRCDSCHLFCLLNRTHDGKDHNCLTSHTCAHSCEYIEEHPESDKVCGYPAGHAGKHVCVVEEHLCGEPCVLKGKVGCLLECSQIAGHTDQEHRCSARIHACGLPCKLSLATVPNHPNGYKCKGTCAMSSEKHHDEHVCDNRMCPIKCELCNRLCSSHDHLHSLCPDAVHLCSEIHACQSLCSAAGICEIDTAPQSIEATFTGRHETFQYTKYSQVAKRLHCVIPIPPMQRAHKEKHSHTIDPKPFHFCEKRCLYCGYYCTLPLGHSQQEHETSHGSMSKSRWAIEDPDLVVELQGRKFASDDDGAPMMCNLLCTDMGRHVHIDFCRAASENTCNAPDVQHIRARLDPEPSKPKDWITHELFWKRSAFKDPYSRDERTNFSKCDSMCSGPEHSASNPAQPSYCTLPIFHAPHTATGTNELGYTSHDGHQFSCKNPAVMQQAFHVIFVIDRSGSMAGADRQPLPGTPVTRQIAAGHNNRLGAVYSSLHSFWTSRMSVVSGRQGQQATARRDAYSVVLFDRDIANCILNDFTSSPEQLLNMVLHHAARGGTDYTLAVRRAQDVMRQHWSTDRNPVVIFLSDGECSIHDQDMQTLCRAAVALGKPLSFHGVSFGPKNSSLRRMVQIARDIERTMPRDPLLPQAAFVESSFAEALDSVRLAETFLGIAEALKKPRGALFA